VNKNKKISIEDQKTWKDFTKNPTDIFDKDKNQNKILFNNKRFKYDLHGYSLADANEKVKELILWCIEKKYKEILLITGKGIHSQNHNDVFVSENFSKLKYSVPNYINSKKELLKHILSISDAEDKNGGAGAIIIKLRKL
tara:strand:- start:49 stop:468 length:420 start_codon:yes stop_codon:yes gene_type:complete